MHLIGYLLYIYLKKTYYLIITHKYDLIKESEEFVLLDFGGVLWG